MTVIHMPTLRNGEALQLLQNFAAFSSASFSLALLTSEDVGIAFAGQSHHNMFGLSKAMNDADKGPDGSMAGFSGKRILCAQFNTGAYQAIVKSADLISQNIFQYTPEASLDRAFVLWVTKKNQEPDLRNQPIRFSPIHEETYTRDIFFPSLALLQEFEALRSTGFFDHEAARIVQAETSRTVVNPGQR